eukprot:symbB.v1.2.021756.t2/scaffold1897.1/size96769/8
MACDIIKFYKWGMFLCFVIATIALYLAIKCPYSTICPAGFAAMLITGIFSAATGIIMFFVKRSLNHVRKLYIDDLSAKKMTAKLAFPLSEFQAKTQQCGSIAKKCPCWSRWLFFFTSLGVVMGFSVGVLLSTCPDAGDALWQGLDCEMKTPDPKAEFGVLFVESLGGDESSRHHIAMDPEACLGILSRAHAAHAKSDANGTCCKGPEGGNGHGYPVSQVQKVSEVNVSDSMGCGQVLDVESGENQTLGPEFTEEVLLQRFPKLKGSNQAPISGSGAVENTFDGDIAADIVLSAVALQEERVAVYKDYDAAFKFLLEAREHATRALAWLYPFIVKMATSRFQAISQGVRSLASELETRSEATRQPLASQAGKSTRCLDASTSDAFRNHKVDEAAGALRALQRMEAERLQLVAAHHAEQGRQLLAENDDAVQASLKDVKRRLGKISLVLAILSTRVNAQKKPWPFLYEPEPEDTSFKGRGIFAFCAPCDMLSRQEFD